MFLPFEIYAFELQKLLFCMPKPMLWENQYSVLVKLMLFFRYFISVYIHAEMLKLGNC